MLIIGVTYSTGHDENLGILFNATLLTSAVHTLHNRTSAHDNKGVIHRCSQTESSTEYVTGNRNARGPRSHCSISVNTSLSGADEYLGVATDNGILTTTIDAAGDVGTEHRGCMFIHSICCRVVLNARHCDSSGSTDVHCGIAIDIGFLTATKDITYSTNVIIDGTCDKAINRITTAGNVRNLRITLGKSYGKACLVTLDHIDIHSGTAIKIGCRTVTATIYILDMGAGDDVQFGIMVKLALGIWRSRRIICNTVRHAGSCDEDRRFLCSRIFIAIY